ncbi:uncharacterized protein LOC128953294 [Oppia nitens]|uniref:uncharacterized protein LOC128953294 n=1 Tax=Oppia nitens TaxID=1686743 RepID=UPI0023DCAAA2|nr:uncharacterized protein LOC128953294 [Oppia nitens]
MFSMFSLLSILMIITVFNGCLCKDTEKAAAATVTIKCESNPWPKLPVLRDSELKEKTKLMSLKKLTKKNQENIKKLVKWFQDYSQQLIQQDQLDYLGSVYEKLSQDLNKHELGALATIGKLGDDDTKIMHLAQNNEFHTGWLKYLDNYMRDNCTVESFNVTSDLGELKEKLSEIRQKLFETLQKFIDGQELDKDRQFWTDIDKTVLKYLKSHSDVDKNIDELKDDSVKVKTLQTLLIDNEVLLRGYNGFNQ